MSGTHVRGFCFSEDLLSNLHDYGGYGDLTAVYGCDDKKLRGFAYRNHIMVEHSQPDGQVSCYEYDRYDIDGKVLKSSNNLGEEWTFDYHCDKVRSLVGLTNENGVRYRFAFEYIKEPNGSINHRLFRPNK